MPGGIFINNGGTASIFVGGSAVTTASGFPIASSATLVVPTTGAEPLSLYGISTAAGMTVKYLFPG
jgi:hypothetical protein